MESSPQPRLDPFPFYYERLPTYSEVYHALSQRTDVSLGRHRYEETWFQVCLNNGLFQLWNKEYIQALADKIRSVIANDLIIEVCAGDGMLSHWLREHEVNIRASDNMQTQIKTHSEVEKLGAISTIRKYKPRMVVASWINYGSELDCDIIDEKPEFLILMGEGPNGCTGSEKFWGDRKEPYWQQGGYTQEFLEADKWNICRSDNDPLIFHRRYGYTTLYSAATC